jgi:hypothetical protein
MLMDEVTGLLIDAGICLVKCGVEGRKNIVEHWLLVGALTFELRGEPTLRAVMLTTHC